jgi:hypothetical protein
MFSGDQLRWPPDKKRPSSGFTVTGPLAGTSKNVPLIGSIVATQHFSKVTGRLRSSAIRSGIETIA